MLSLLQYLQALAIHPVVYSQRITDTLFCMQESKGFGIMLPSEHMNSTAHVHQDLPWRGQQLETFFNSPAASTPYRYFTSQTNTSYSGEAPRPYPSSIPQAYAQQMPQQSFFQQSWARDRPWNTAGEIYMPSLVPVRQ